jgi:hypothetical protein
MAAKTMPATAIQEETTIERRNTRKLKRKKKEHMQVDKS